MGCVFVGRGVKTERESVGGCRLDKSGTTGVPSKAPCHCGMADRIPERPKCWKLCERSESGQIRFTFLGHKSTRNPILSLSNAWYVVGNHEQGLLCVDVIEVSAPAGEFLLQPTLLVPLLD